MSRRHRPWLDAEAVVRFAEQSGFELTPWQVEVIERLYAVRDGKWMFIPGGRRFGRTTIQRVIESAEATHREQADFATLMAEARADSTHRPEPPAPWKPTPIQDAVIVDEVHHFTAAEHDELGRRGWLRRMLDRVFS